MATPQDLSKVITEWWVDFIKKSLENQYDYEVQARVKQFENDLIRKRDEVVAWAILHITRMMEIDTRQDRIIITIRNV